MNRTVFAVDIGTSSLKAALIDSFGEVLAAARVRFPRAQRTGEHWENALSSAWAAVHSQLGDFTPNAVSVSGNGPTLASVSQDGRASAVLLWNDPLPPITAESGAGKTPSLFIPRIQAFQSLHPREFSEASSLLSGPEYIVWRLTGSPVTILPDPRYEKAYWTAGDLSAEGLSGVPLAPFLLAGQRFGLTNGTAGIPAGIPVTGCGPDFTAALLGTGTIEPGTACDRAGTSEGLNLCLGEPISAEAVRTLPGAVPGVWNASYILSETGAIFHTWRRDNGLAAMQYPELMKQIEQSPIVPEHQGILHPGRKVVEEIGFAVRRGIETLNAIAGKDLVWRLSGGQARNEIWNRMKADITGARFALTRTPDGELMGDAIAGFAMLGEYASMEEAARAMVRIDKMYEPDPENHLLYTEKYRTHAHL